MQIPLDLGHRPALGRADFLVAEGNADAVGWIDLWPDWPAPALVLYGPPACGKSHLAHVWQMRSHAVFLDSRDFEGDIGGASERAQALAGRGEAFILDPADFLVGNRDQETILFHLFNLLKERSGFLVVTFRDAPVRLPFCVPDLASRLRAAPAVSIHRPDESILEAVLIKLFADRQIRISEDSLRYTLARMERSFSAAREIVDRADAKALSERRKINVPLIRDVLEEMNKPEG